jgi:predicted HicB family RNase H-like nuclease
MKNLKHVLKHKGFTGVYSYLEDEKIFFGKLNNITDLVTFEAYNIRDIENAFIEAVEDYIELCEEVGKSAFPLN